MDPTSRDPVVASKILFITALNDVIRDYVANEKPLETAKKLFTEYMISTNDQPYIVRQDFQLTQNIKQKNYIRKS